MMSLSVQLLYSFSAWSVYSNRSWHEKYHRKLYDPLWNLSKQDNLLSESNMFYVSVSAEPQTSVQYMCMHSIRKWFCASCRHQCNVVFINTPFLGKSMNWYLHICDQQLLEFLCGKSQSEPEPNLNQFVPCEDYYSAYNTRNTSLWQTAKWCEGQSAQ